MGLPFRLYLNASRLLICTGCGTHLATPEEVISKQFQGQHGNAYLMYKVVNVSTGAAQERRMTTGLHVVMDVFCIVCQKLLGWKYETAYEESQKYKEGKYILEKELINEISTIN
jgi:hypothetical protein